MQLAAQLDHVPFGVVDLAAAGEMLRALGFVPVLGRCSWSLGGRNFRAGSLSVMFADNYLDFIEIDTPGWRDHVSSSRLYGRGIAPSGIVFRCESVSGASAAVGAAGLKFASAYRIERSVSGAEPEVMHYDIFNIKASALPLSFIRDSDPAAMRRPSWLDHPNTATGVRRVWLAAADPASARRDAERLFPGNLVGDTLRAGKSSLVLAGADDQALRSARRIHPATGRSELFALEFVVSDPTRLHQTCSQAGFRSTHRHDFGVELDPGEGLGCALSFVPARSMRGS